MTCPDCRTALIETVIGVTVSVYHGPVDARMVEGWLCAGCGYRAWRDAVIALPSLDGAARGHAA